MITGTLRSTVDKLWEAFWTGGVSNPLTGHRGKRKVHYLN